MFKNDANAGDLSEHSRNVEANLFRGLGAKNLNNHMVIINLV